MQRMRRLVGWGGLQINNLLEDKRRAGARHCIRIRFGHLELARRNATSGTCTTQCHVVQALSLSLVGWDNHGEKKNDISGPLSAKLLAKPDAMER
jgi:hypothetical protein